MSTNTCEDPCYGEHGWETEGRITVLLLESGLETTYRPCPPPGPDRTAFEGGEKRELYRLHLHMAVYRVRPEPVRA